LKGGKRWSREGSGKWEGELPQRESGGVGKPEVPKWGGKKEQCV